MTDISSTLAPNSDQLDAVDLRGNPPRIFTITKIDVRQNSDQPVSIQLAEFPRVWRPGKSMRRVLAFCWGNDSSVWVGRRVELYCDDRVSFGGEQIGGTRVSRLSHIDGPKSIPLIIGRGKSGVFKVKPLPDAAPEQADGMVTKAQLSALATEYEDKGLTSREQVLEFLEKTIGHPVKSSKDLTEDEAAKVLTELAKVNEPAAAGEPA